MDIEELDPTGHCLERDLCASEFIVEKVNGDKTYAQHLYAAMCNNDFTKNEIWPILQQEVWSCSWRYSGGIIAAIRGEGDYMDWYCSGAAGEEITPEEDVKYLEEDEIRTYLTRKSNVLEGVITEEIRTDLLRLGWIVVTDNTED